MVFIVQTLFTSHAYINSVFSDGPDPYLDNRDLMWRQNRPTFRAVRRFDCRDRVFLTQGKLACMLTCVS